MLISSLRTVCVVALLVVGSSVAIAQEQKRSERPEGAERRQRENPLAGPDVAVPKQRDGKGMSGRQMGGRGNPIQVMIQELDLSEEQKEKIRTISAEHQAATRLWKQENGEQLAELRTAMAAAREAQNQEQAKALQQQQRELQATGPQPKALVEELRAVLTAAQIQELDAKLEARRKEAMEARQNKEGKQRPQNMEGRTKRQGEEKGGDGERRERPAKQLDL